MIIIPLWIPNTTCVEQDKQHQTQYSEGRHFDGVVCSVFHMVLLEAVLYVSLVVQRQDAIGVV
jgi:hypothetical protein